MPNLANLDACDGDISETIPEHSSAVGDSPPAVETTAASRAQQPPAAVVLSWWTEERIETLKEHWSVGDSATIIAAAMHTTRNAILGKVHRLGLVSRALVKRVDRPARLKSVFKSMERKPQRRFRSSPALLVVISAITGAPAGYTKRVRPPVAEMTKNQLRAMLTQALVNTAKLAIVP